MPGTCAVAGRYGNSPGNRYVYNGFRVARTEILEVPFDSDTSREKQDNFPPSANAGLDKDSQKDLAVYNRSDEENAVQRLKLAESFIHNNKPDAAKLWLRDVVDRYPNTDACKKCKKLLKQLAVGASGGESLDVDTGGLPPDRGDSKHTGKCQNHAQK